MTPIAGPVTLMTAIAMNVWFLKGAFDIWRRNDVAAEVDNFKVEKSFFRFSIFYLFAHFGALLVDAGLRAGGLT